MKEISWFDNLINHFLELIDEYKPFRKHLREVFVNYDRSICVFFQIVQYLYIYLVVTAFIYAILIVNHYLKNSLNEPYMNEKCGYYWHCFYFYSRISIDEKWEFAFTNLIFALVGTAYCLYLWVRFYRVAKYQEVFQKDGMQYSRLILNSQAWSTDNSSDFFNRQTSLLNETLLKLKEDKIR